MKEQEQVAGTRSPAPETAAAPALRFLRRGSFAGFVVMLGGVKTKDVLSLT